MTKKHLIAPAATLFAAGFFSVQTASASLLIYEPFDYTAGQAIAGQVNPSTSGTWNAAGAASATVHSVSSPSLTSPSGFPASVGNSGTTVNADSTQFDRLDLPASFGINTSLYYSLLFNVPDIAGLTTVHTNANANNDGMIMFNNGVGASAGRPSNWAGELTIRLGNAAGTYNLGVRASNTTAATTFWTGDLNPGDTHLIVVRYTQGPTDSLGTDDSNDLWVDPSAATFGAASAPAPDGSSNGTINASSPPNNFATSILVGAGIAAGATPNAVNLDEIRVGDTWADVTTVPEPASLGLLALGGLGLLARRRRENV